MFFNNYSPSSYISVGFVPLKDSLFGNLSYNRKDRHLRITNMARAVVTVLTVLMVSVYGCGVDSAFTHLPCDSDPQCPDGYFCYQESHLCSRCVECSAYKRKTSWRLCPKVPSDCGECHPGFEEDILHEGKTREMCVPSQNNPNSLSHTVVSVPHYERYIWAGVIVILALPIVFFAFFRKRERGTIHHGLPREQPPPYRSIELSSLSGNNSEERLAEDEVVLRVGQQKDNLVQAVPFRCPNYMDPQEFMTFDNFHDNNSEGGSQTDGNTPSAPPDLDLDDENTMPSDWTPAPENTSSEQLMSFESGEVSAADLSGSEADDTCEPVSKRRRSSESQADEDNCNTHLNINLFINNNVTIHKQS